MPTVPLPVLPGPSAADCCAPRVGLDHVAIVAKALSEPLQVHVLDVLRRSREPELVDAGLVRVERRHKWAYYSVVPDAAQELSTWLS